MEESEIKFLYANNILTIGRVIIRIQEIFQTKYLYHNSIKKSLKKMRLKRRKPTLTNANYLLFNSLK